MHECHTGSRNRHSGRAVRQRKHHNLHSYIDVQLTPAAINPMRHDEIDNARTHRSVDADVGKGFF